MSVAFTSFPGVLENVSAARRFVAGALRIAPAVTVPAEVVEKAEVIASELCTNAIVHTRSGDPGRTFHLRVQVDTHGVRGEVRTRLPRRLSSVPRLVAAAPWAESGRGLHLVDALATTWGTLTPVEEGTFFLLQWLPEQQTTPHRAKPLGAV
ncbi:ATP-binding protein [Allosalinactinospora lopnorensis]|uniref:ATP-binding protein n=1 Tax=Allosalinactinospora lopnorensis TaxID=1352348 RepID=UPI000623C898|nr:ATP-binding protein [Allosalinactinospora lopnorensis]